MDPTTFTYSYTMLSPCLFDSSKINTNLSCSNVSECRTDLRKYALSEGSSSKNEYTMVGIAKDGNIIVSPWMFGK